MLCLSGCGNPKRGDDTDETYKDVVKQSKEGSEDIVEKFIRVVQFKQNSQDKDESLFKVAEYNLTLKKYFIAKKFLREHYDLYPESSHRDQVIYYLAKIEIMRGDELYAKDEWQRALRHYEEAFRIDLLNVEIVEKIQQCELKINKDDAQKLTILGDLDYEMGRLSDASVAYYKAAELDPDNMFVKEKINLARREMNSQKDFKQIQEEFEKFHIERGFTRVDGVWIEKEVLQE